MFTVATPATIKWLTTLATLKADLGITTGDEDVYLEEKISQVSAAVVSYLKVPKASDGTATLGAESLVETFRFEPASLGSANPRKHLILARRPVTQVASVTVGTVTLDPSQYELDGAAGLLLRLRSDRMSSWDGCSKVVVANTAGWLLPDKGTDRTLPFDIESAVISMIRQARSAKDRDPMVKAEWTTDIERIEYWVGSTGVNGAFPPDVAGLLEPFRYRGRL